jgi:hypothetical protein
VYDFNGLPRGTGGAAGLGVAAARCPRWIGRAGALGPRLPPTWVGSLRSVAANVGQVALARLPPTWVRSLSLADCSAVAANVGQVGERGSGRRRQRGSGPGPAARRVLVCYRAARVRTPRSGEARPGCTHRVTARFGRALRRRRCRRRARRVAPGGSRLVTTPGSPGVVPYEDQRAALAGDVAGRRRHAAQRRRGPASLGHRARGRGHGQPSPAPHRPGGGRPAPLDHHAGRERPSRLPRRAGRSGRPRDAALRLVP